MILTLLGHQWKAFWRSRSTGRNVAMQVFLGIILLYFIGLASLLGFSMEELLQHLFPGQNRVTVFSGLILYFFAIDILIRFLMQDLPTLTIQPYLAQNIKRRQLILFLNIRSLFSFFNLLPFLLFTPFIGTAVVKAYGSGSAWAFLLSIAGLMFFNHYLVLFIKRKTILNSWWLVGFFGAVLLLMLLDYYNLVSLRTASAALFTAILKAPLLALLAVVLAVAALYNHSRFLRRHLYIEENARSNDKKRVAEYRWLQQWGILGELMTLDLKLIFRNKRPRSLLLISLVFLLYGFIFYKPQYLEQGQLGPLLMGAIFLTGMFMTNYGQFLFAWQSNHFDGLMAGKISITTYLKSKFLLLTAFSTAALLVSLLYGFMNWKIIPIQVAAYFFNIGINTVLAAFMATFNYQGLDISKGSSFNFQGTGATQWLFALVIALVGVVIYLPFALVINAWAGIAAIGILGFTNLLLQDWWIQKLSLRFLQRKHKLLAGFREK